MNSISLTYNTPGSFFSISLIKESLLHFYILVSPFYMFAVAFGKDWPALWAMGFLAILFLIEFLYKNGKFWFDRSFYFLLWFLAVYIISTIVVLLSDTSLNLLGRSAQDRALTTTIRLSYVIIAFMIFVNFLADGNNKTLHRIFLAQIFVGVAIALFGIVQYVSVVFFSSSTLLDIEPTNETFKLGSSFFGLGQQRFYRAAAVFHEPSTFGFFLVPLLMKTIIARMQNIIIVGKGIHLVIIAIFIGAMVVNLSFTGILAAGVLLFLLLISSLRESKHFGKIILAVFVVLAAVLVSPLGSVIVGRLDRVFGFRDVSTLDRLFRAFVAVRVFSENPLVGVAPGGFAFWYLQFGGFERSGLATPLNIWLTFLTDVGIVGFAPFLLFLINVFRRGRKAIKRHPLVRVYLWSCMSFLLLLTTVDQWFLEGFWFELAMLLTLASSYFVVEHSKRDEFRLSRNHLISPSK